MTLSEGQSSSKDAGVEELEDDHQDETVIPMHINVDDVTPEILRGWLRRAKRKFVNGVIVLKITSQGKIVRRTVFVGAKSEYFEITSAKLFDLGYHMSDIEEVSLGCDSPDFAALKKLHPERIPNADKSCVVRVESRPISLVFKSEADRRDFMFLMRVEMRALSARYQVQASPAVGASPTPVAV